MRIPVDWLAEYVANDLSAQELDVVLTDVGLEVEAIEHTAGAAVLDITVTPNRGDCLSVVGVARELAMTLQTEMKTREPQVVETGPPASELATIVLDDPALCPRYSARVVRKVQIGPSPEWAQRRLEQCGLRPINNVVDATNLAMLELGQPLHAFDYRLLRAPEGETRPQIIVRRAEEGERLVTIDGEDRQLGPGILVIADPGGPVALAGIIGGTESEIHGGTTEVLLESAHFDPTTIRRGARALGVNTEASYRFERTVDPGGTVRTLDRACELIVEFCQLPVEIARGVVDAYPNPIEETEIALRPERVNELLGVELSAAEMAAHLRRLQLRVREGSPMMVTAPTFRQDLKEEIDLVEEVARAHGYRNIPERLPGVSAGVGRLAPGLQFEREVRSIMRGLGLSEAVTSSLEGPDDLARLHLPEGHPLSRPVVISNARTAERSQLRTTFLTSLLHIVAENRRHGVGDVSIFDLGRVHLSRGTDALPEEPQHLGIAGTGVRWRGEWAIGREPARWDFYAMKAVVEALVASLTRKRAEFVPDRHPCLNASSAARITIGDTEIGYLGEVSSEVRNEYHLPDAVYVAEMNVELLQKYAARAPQYQPVSRFPAMTRDVAFLLPRSVAAARAEAVIRNCAGDSLESLSLFDAYEGMPLSEGQRNLAFSLTFRRPDRTLTDEEVESVMGRVRAALSDQLGAQIRA